MEHVGDIQLSAQRPVLGHGAALPELRTAVAPQRSQPRCILGMGGDGGVRRSKEAGDSVSKCGGHTQHTCCPGGSWKSAVVFDCCVFKRGKQQTTIKRLNLACHFHVENLRCFVKQRLITWWQTHLVISRLWTKTLTQICDKNFRFHLWPQTKKSNSPGVAFRFVSVGFTQINLDKRCASPLPFIFLRSDL